MPRSVAIPVDRRACTPIETVVHHHEALRFAGSSYQRRPQADCGIPGCQRLSKIEIYSYIRRTRSGLDTEVAERLDLIFSGALDADEAVSSIAILLATSRSQPSSWSRFAATRAMVVM